MVHKIVYLKQAKSVIQYPGSAHPMVLFTLVSLIIVFRLSIDSVKDTKSKIISVTKSLLELTPKRVMRAVFFCIRTIPAFECFVN